MTVAGGRECAWEQQEGPVSAARTLSDRRGIRKETAEKRLSVRVRNTDSLCWAELNFVHSSEYNL